MKICDIYVCVCVYKYVYIYERVFICTHTISPYKIKERKDSTYSCSKKCEVPRNKFNKKYTKLI